MVERVFLHVGSPKTGSTFLQEVLWSQRDKAESQGLLLPLGSFFDHFLGTVDVRELADPERYPERTAGTWNRIVEEGLRWPGTVLVSHELFAAATADQAARAVEAWGGVDVHVIVTARDLARQIPAEWQEHLKHRSTITLGDFIEALRDRSQKADWFWLVQDFADVCRRWGSTLPPSHVHVVTVPAPGAAPDLLWTRFATLIGLDPGAFELTTSRANPSLKAEQAELLRRINAGLGERLPIPGPYPPTVKEVFAQQILQGRPGLAITLDKDSKAFAYKRSLELVGELEQLGVDVVGDLDELVPADTGTSDLDHPTRYPETLTSSDLIDESVEALAGLLARLSQERERADTAERAGHHLERELETARAQLAGTTQRLDHLERQRRDEPLRHLLIGLSETHPWMMRQRVRYWHAMERIRRLARRRTAE